MTVTIKTSVLEGFLQRCFEAGGFSPVNAQAISAHLLDAEMCGMSSHGVNRLGWYLEQAANGLLNPEARPQVAELSPNAVAVDGQGGIGIVAMEQALQEVTARAKSGLIAMAGITNCGHTGRLGAYAEQAARDGCLAICTGGGGRHSWSDVVPFGGRKPVMSTNPYALALPGAEGQAAVCDFAISTVAAGKVAVARANGSELPEGCIVDAEGNPSTDPEDFYSGGSLLPAAGAKGSGLGILAELIGSALLGPAKEFNWLMIAIRADAFQTEGIYCREAKAFSDLVRSTPPAPGFDRVRMPGDLEAERRAACIQSAHLTLSDGVARGLKLAAESVGQPDWESRASGNWFS